MLQIFRIVHRSFIFLIVFNVVLFSAGLRHKLFDIEKGMVLYDISGGGKLTDDTNLSIVGHGKLRFKDWGIFALIEEEYEEKTAGAVKSIENIKKCEKFEEKQRLDVDFKKRKILERKLPKGNLKNYIVKGLVQNGQDEVAGYTCDVWEGNGIKKCLYKGVPLLVEYYSLGIYYQKKASLVKLNINTDSTSKCSVPDYPVEKFSLFKARMKSQELPHEISKVLMTVSKVIPVDEDNLNKKQKRIWLNKIGENIFKKQKLLLPQFLAGLKNTRVCLYQAESAKSANQCLRDIVSLKAQLTKEKENHIEQWKGKEKNKVLNSFDKKISFLEPKMKCIRGAQNIADLSQCMK